MIAETTLRAGRRITADDRYALRLRHYAHRGPVGPIESREQGAPDAKPRGLWVSVEGNGDGWREWCEAEDFRTDWTHAYDVTLTEGANILLLSTPYDLDDFTEDFERVRDDARPWRHGLHIDWRRVAEEYDGIIITPYQWRRRMELMWYYGWDCASGCIWRSDAIAALNQVEVRP